VHLQVWIEINVTTFLTRSSWYQTAHCPAWGQLQASPVCLCDMKSNTITRSTKHWCIILTGENRSTIEKAHPSAAVSPTKLTRNRTRAFAVKGRRIIASAMANSIAAVDIKSPYKRSPMKWYQAVSPSVCVCQRGPHWTIYVNSQIDDFYGIWREIPNLVKTWKKYRAFYIKS